MNKSKLKILPFIIILIGISTYFYQTQQVLVNDFRYTGTVEGSEISIGTEVPGELINMTFSEGKQVDVGDVLFEIDVSDYDIQLAQLKLRQEIATLSYEQLLEGASDEDVNLASSNKNSIAKQLSGARLSYNHLKAIHGDLKILYDSGAVSKTELDQSKLGVDQAYTTIRSIEAQVNAAQATLNKVLSGAEDETLAIAQMEIELRSLEIENLENKILKGKKIARISGVIQTINYDVGEYMTPGKPILSIINVESLTIDVYIRERNLYQVTVGDPVVITEAFLEGKEVVGEVVSISSKAEFTPKNVESKESKQEMVFKTRIEIKKGQEYLRPGMFVDVDIQVLNE